MLPKLDHPVHNSGQSLIEVLVALTLAVLAIGALVSVTMTSVKNAQFSKNQIQAEKYAQEGMEWIRLQKESLVWTNGTDGFYDKNGSWCLDNTASNVWTSLVSPPCVKISSTIFTRSFSLSQTPPKTVSVVITVTWQDSSGTHNAIRDTLFTDWK